MNTEEEHRHRVIVDPTGGCMTLLIELGALIVIIILASWLFGEIGKWLAKNWWVVAIIALIIGLVLFVNHMMQLQAEEKRSAEAKAEALRRKADESARNKEIEAQKRDKQAKLLKHQERMDSDTDYRDAWMAVVRREMMADRAGLDPDNPFLEQATPAIPDAEVWEEAYYEAPLSDFPLCQK